MCNGGGLTSSTRIATRIKLQNVRFYEGIPENLEKMGVPDDDPRDALHSTIVQVVMYCIELRQ